MIEALMRSPELLSIALGATFALGGAVVIAGAAVASYLEGRTCARWSRERGRPRPLRSRRRAACSRADGAGRAAAAEGRASLHVGDNQPRAALTLPSRPVLLTYDEWHGNGDR